MRELPIIFNTEMVNAILEGRKTQTRRVMRFQPPSNDYKLGTIIEHSDSKALGKFHWVHPNAFFSMPEYFSCPYGQVGDFLYVRETWCKAMATAYRQSPGVEFTPDSDDPSIGAVYKAGWTRAKPGRWKPSIHMPKKYARIWLRVRDIRVERVQDISEEDVQAEGCTGSPFGRLADIFLFPELWNSINEKRGYGWDVNPWVWVIEFERINHGQRF